MLFSTMVSQLTGKVLDVPGGTSDHVPMEQFKMNPGPDPLGSSNQQWLFVPAPRPGDSDLEYDSYIVSRVTGQTLEVSALDFERDLRPLHMAVPELAPVASCCLTRLMRGERHEGIEFENTCDCSSWVGRGDIR